MPVKSDLRRSDDHPVRLHQPGTRVTTHRQLSKVCLPAPGPLGARLLRQDIHGYHRHQRGPANTHEADSRPGGETAEGGTEQGHAGSTPGRARARTASSSKASASLRPSEVRA